LGLGIRSWLAALPVTLTPNPNPKPKPKPKPKPNPKPNPNPNTSLVVLLRSTRYIWYDQKPSSAKPITRQKTPGYG
jgi:hypothetical protein